MTLRIVALIALTQTLAACTTRDDDYMLLRRAADDGGPGAAVRLGFAPANDADAWYLHHLLADGFGAELLRTYAMTKRFAARTDGQDEAPTYLVLGDRPGHDARKEVEMRFWRASIPQTTPLIWLPRHSSTAMTDLVSALAQATIDAAVPQTTDPLRAGYIEFIQVVAAEWRPPRAIDDRDELRRLSGYARVRGNEAVLYEPPLPRPAQHLANDPDVIATVLYRMAASKLGQEMAAEETYRPFLAAPAPHDVHPALLLGAFRNFQAKLLAAWGGAARANRAPRDLVDLVEIYAAAYPAERAEATRIFMITTYGATVVAKAVRADGEPEQVVSQLAVLTADVLFGRRGLRDGYDIIGAPAR